MNLDGLRVLVVGGGIGGMSVAIQLRKGGAAVDLVDLDPEWRVYGAGITISGPTFRAYETLGIRDDLIAHGYLTDGLVVYGSDGTLFTKIPGNPVINSAGITRPKLHDILARRVRASGTNVRLGLSVGALHQNGVASVRFTDGTSDSYDLVVAADGIFSTTRELLFPDAPKPRFTGQGGWRLLIDRPQDVKTGYLFLGRGTKAGLTPCSPSEMYMFLLNTSLDNPRIDPSAWHTELHELMAAFSAPLLAQLRAGLQAQSKIVYRPLEGVFLPPPWHSGAAIIIGDAAHATTPHLACGAGLAVEDAIVLVEELAAAPSIEGAFRSFMERRYERCKMVVESSLHIGQLEMASAPDDEIMGIVGRTMSALMAPI